MNRIVSTGKEKLCYAFGNMGGYILWVFTASYITVYATDCLQFSSDGWAYGVLGTIILISRFFDGLSDIGMGILIDRTHTKWGKARPWFGISILPLSAVFLMLFTLKGSSEAAALTKMGILYFLFTVVFYTINNISFNAMMPLISNDSYDQTRISTLDSIFTSVGSLAAAMAIPILSWLGGSSSQSSWLTLTAALAILAAAAQAVCFFGVHEKKEIAPIEARPMAKGELKKGFQALLHTKYFYIAVSMFLINFYMSLSISSVGKYYAQWILGNANYYSLMGSLPMVTMGVGLLATPLFTKKFGKRKAMMIAVGFVLAGNIVGSFAPKSLAVALTGAMIKGFGSATVMCELYTLAPDIVRYIQQQSGVRVEGLAASSNSFGCKIGSGIGSAVVIWTIAACRYDASASVLPAATGTAFIALYWWVPVLLSAVLLLLASRWDIEDAMHQKSMEGENTHE
jgi:GPH family glycoside/pentoside/hexuronide:cation symporter